MKTVGLIIGCVVGGYVAHKLAGKYIDPAFTKVHEALKAKLAKKGKEEAAAPAA